MTSPNKRTLPFGEGTRESPFLEYPSIEKLMSIERFSTVYVSSLAKLPKEAIREFAYMRRIAMVVVSLKFTSVQ